MMMVDGGNIDHSDDAKGQDDRSLLAQARRIHIGASYWSELPRIRIFISGLPQVVTTLEIHENFRCFGEIVFIKVLESRGPGGSSRAEVEYGKPPQRPFWPRKVSFRCRGLVFNVAIRLSNIQPEHIKIESPIREGVEYETRVEIRASALHFGVLLEPDRMITFASRGTDHDQVRIVLDLKKKQIEINFSSPMISKLDETICQFRFFVALDEDFEIWHLIKDNSYILHLTRPPWYSKQVMDTTEQTLTSGARRWSIEDTWVRQTDIVNHREDIQYISESPTSLQKTGNIINIARWTTFKIDIIQDEANVAADRVFQDALRDFNINLMNGEDIEIVPGGDEMHSKAWKLLHAFSDDGDDVYTFREQKFGALPFAVRYQLEVCLSHGWLSEYALTEEFLGTLSDIGPEKAKQTLLHLDATRQREWYPMQLFENLRYQQPVKFKELPEGCMEIRSAVVTATTIQFNSPSVEVTNRIIRKYKMHVDRFLRVRFEDDKWRGQSRLYPGPSNKMIQVFQRVLRVLQHGIRLGNMHYEFIAWGNSQLREHGAYFFAKVDDVSADVIRAKMGFFDQEKVVAKRAARMGQCFSTTRPIHLHLPTITEDTTIPDISTGRYNFTDGVGKISPVAAQMIHSQLKIKGTVPSAFQFRLGGCKGVLVTWPAMLGIDVKVRASQFKFSSSSKDLEIIRWSELWQPFLNRQLILCLSHLGIPDQVFLRMQQETMASLDEAMLSDTAALKALRDTVDPNSMTLSMCELVEAGFRSPGEPFVTALLQLWRSWTLKYLKEKAKIPVRKGAFVLGCADETGNLRGHYDQLFEDEQAPREIVPDLLPEIFLQITNHQTGKREVITGNCILARNPSLHRGDIRVVRAVEIPALCHLCDVVVMPTNGDRDLPSMCSGGDLDGDDYIVIWDPDLIPQSWQAEAFHYEAPDAKVVADKIDTNDIINFFYDYLQNDCLGRIAHAHLAAADYLDEGIQSDTCLELVQLHSMAVDYPKTGVPAIMKASLDRTTWPHFMEKKRANSYHSRKVLGQLYDAVEKVAFDPRYDAPFDEDLLSMYGPNEQLRASLVALKHDYDSAMQRIMARHDIKTEFEVFSTFVLSHSKASGDFKFHEEIGNISRALKEQYKCALVELAGGSSHELLAPVAVAAYQYTSLQVKTGLKEIEEHIRLAGPEGMPFLSFGWILQDTLCWLKANVGKHDANGGIDQADVDCNVDLSCRKIHKWLDNMNSTVKSITGMPLAPSTNAKAASIGNKQDPPDFDGFSEGKAADVTIAPNWYTTKNMLCDPFTMTMEQRKQMGMGDDMELQDELDS